METDRPDITESAYTVDAGHFQYEGDLGRLTSSTAACTKTNKLALNNGTYKMGVTNTLDFHLVFENYILNYAHPKGVDHTLTQGLGDVMLRLKKNIAGDDGGKFAIAILPFVKIPTRSFYDNPHIEWGLIVPFSINYSRDWNLSGEVQWQSLRQSGDRKYRPLYLQSFAAEHEVAKWLAYFIETHFTWSGLDKTLQNFADGGLILLLSENIHLDCGINYGIQSYAYKSYFLGMSFRI